MYGYRTRINNICKFVCKLLFKSDKVLFLDMFSALVLTLFARSEA